MTETKASAALVTGIQAAGKSTVAKMLAGRFKRGAFVEGDLMWQMIVSGRVDMTPDPDPEAVRQLHLRYKHAGLLVDSLVEAGFTTIHADIVLENDLLHYPQRIRARPLRIVVLAPNPEAVIARERARGSRAYRHWEANGADLDKAVRAFQGYLDATPRLGLWINSSAQTPGDTVDEILERWDEALVS